MGSFDPSLRCFPRGAQVLLTDGLWFDLRGNTVGLALQGVTLSAARSLQLKQQMEVTQLQYPVTLMGDFLDSGQIVGDDSLEYACWHGWR